MSWSVASLWPLSFLVIAVIDDLCFKKFHNWLFLSLTIAGSVHLIWFSQLSFIEGIGGFVVGGALMLPLVLMGAIGAGDMKFMMCFGLIMGTLMTFEIFVYALFWGALIGVLQSLFAGKFVQLIQNMSVVFFKLKPANPQKIPYTVAILFGWLTHLSAGGLL